MKKKKLISFSIEFLNGLTPQGFSEEIMNSYFIPLALLQGFSARYDVEYEFFSACGNIIDSLNYLHKYQSARDFCEELLLLSIKNNKHSLGWMMLFKCYTGQNQIFDASINGCLLLSSLSNLTEIPYYEAVEISYTVLTFFRNFGYLEFASYVYAKTNSITLNEYDKQKMCLCYFNSLFSGDSRENIHILDQAIEYIENKFDDIIKYQEHGILPWLAFLYNIENLLKIGRLEYDKDIKGYINRLENNVDKESINAIKKRVLGNKENSKDDLIVALLNIDETRSIKDFVFETKHLSVIVRNLLQISIENDDIDGILLAGLAINDSSYSFKETQIKPLSTSPMFKPANEELKQQLNNYKYYLLSKITLHQKQILVWLFENLGKVYCLLLDSNKNFQITFLKEWDYKAMKDWINHLSKFYFNSKKDKFNNSRKGKNYDYQVQKEDYEILKKELDFTSLSISADIEEIFIYSSIKMGTFPHNLILANNDFIASKHPICNVISIERFIENSNSIYMPKNYSVAAWIPIEDQEPIINWGFNIIEPTLVQINANIFTSTYPKEHIKSDVNIFLAHGVTDEIGFKAIYTNHENKKAIIFPHHVFGKGRIAILFICNSGSFHKDVFSNNTISFSGELLKSGYEAVIAPFWPFDVTMSKIWLDEFLVTFNQGFSINESVWFANKRLSEYDSATSSIYYAPAGCLAMHLYGNPNIYVKL